MSSASGSSCRQSRPFSCSSTTSSRRPVRGASGRHASHGRFREPDLPHANPPSPRPAGRANAGSFMSTVYEEHKDEDGFLYITYSGENTFGC
mmetsp:Transcript_9413/g.29665  ORF Transcript_9413/g.29665 Transcript_9413/m.29665 type:complete len:92 (+) Transcript_9413:216-491(+)